jgi:polar amino acid transport system substrate-binding protein
LCRAIIFENLHFLFDSRLIAIPKDNCCFQNKERIVKTYFGVSRFVGGTYQTSRHGLAAVMLVCGLLFSTLPLPGLAAAQLGPFIMAADGDATSYTGRWTTLIYTEVFKRLGLPFQFDFYTLKRRSAMAEDGSVDGEGSRVYAYGAAHPKLVRVEESVVDLTFALYAANPAVSLSRLEDLPASGLLIEYRRGILICENTLKPLVLPERLSDVTSVEQGIKKLLASRTDLYCDLEVSMLEQLQAPEFKGVAKVRKVLDLGKSVPTYPYLHRKHADLAPRMAEVLKKMKAEGLIEAYRLQVVRELGLAK